MLYAAELRGHGDDLAVQAMRGKMGPSPTGRFDGEAVEYAWTRLWLIDFKIQYVAENK